MEMVIDLKNTRGAGVEAIIRHGEEELYWDVSCFYKENDSGDSAPCLHINQYWARLPEEKQNQLFKLYAAIRDCLSDYSEIIALMIEVQKLTHGLYDAMEIDLTNGLTKLMHWLAFHVKDVSIPESVKTNYVNEGDRPGSREKTYILSDYKELIALTIAIRPMLPIWGEFIHRTKKETGTVYKEYRAFQLLGMTYLAECPAMEKLKTYVLSNIPSDKSMDTAIYRGIGTDVYPNWLLSLVVVNRISVGDISGRDPMKNLLTVMWNFLNNKITGLNTFGENIREKKFSDDGDDGDNGRSRLEEYKVKQKHDLGSLMVLEVFMENYQRVAKIRFADYDEKLLKTFRKALKPMENDRIWPGQVLLAQWVLAPVFPPRGMHHIKKLTVINAIAVAQCWLWQRGHFDLAAMISAQATDNTTSIKLSTMGTGAEIPEETKAILNKNYPYSKMLPNRQKTKPQNTSLVAVDLLHGMLSQRDWDLRLPEDMLEQITGSKTRRRYGCPYNGKALIAGLVAQLSEEEKDTIY